jgi:hypothetical protein
MIIELSLFSREEATTLKLYRIVRYSYKPID